MTRTITMIGVVNIVKLHVILAQSEGDPEIDLVAGEVVARETFSILITTAVHVHIRPHTITNLFLRRMKSSSHGGLFFISEYHQTLDMPTGSTPSCLEFTSRIITDRPILLYMDNGHTTLCSEDFPEKDIQPLCSENFFEMDIQPLCLVKYDMKKPFS